MDPFNHAVPALADTIHLLFLDVLRHLRNLWPDGVVDVDDIVILHPAETTPMLDVFAQQILFPSENRYHFVRVHGFLGSHIHAEIRERIELRHRDVSELTREAVNQVPLVFLQERKGAFPIPH